MIVTRGFTSNTIVTRGYGLIGYIVSRREVLRFMSYANRVLNFISELGG